MLTRTNPLTILILATLLFLALAPAAYAGDPQIEGGPPLFTLKWGSQGDAASQFDRPSGVAVDGSGNVYVADNDNNRIQKFTSAGAFVAKWGSFGSDDGQFKGPEDVAVDARGNVYVADTENNRIQKFTGSGLFLARWGSQGSGDGHFKYPTGVAVDAGGNLYAADYYNYRIQKFSRAGSVTVIMSEDGSPIPFNLTLSATDPDGDTLTWSIQSQASHGVASASGTGTTKAIGYTPAPGYNGFDSFIVQVSDGAGGQDAITVNVIIQPVDETLTNLYLPSS